MCRWWSKVGLTALCRSAMSSRQGSANLSTSRTPCASTFARPERMMQPTPGMSGAGTVPFRKSLLGKRGDRFGDRLQRLFRGFSADRNGFLGAMEIEQVDAPKPGTDHHVGRIAGQARAGDAVLHDLERLDHDGR